MSVRRSRSYTRRFFVLLPLAAALGAAYAPVQAAQPEKATPHLEDSTARIFLTTEYEHPKRAMDPLLIHFVPQEEKCRSMWQDHWREQCFSPLARAGALENNIKMTPQIQGEWRWKNATTLAFYPQQAWPAATSLRIDASALFVPRSVRISPMTLTAHTAPLSVVEAQGRFLVDPQRSGKDTLAFTVVFSTAITDTNAIEKGLSLQITGEAQGMTLGSAHFVWSPDKTSVYITVPVTSIPLHSVVATARLPSIASRTQRLADGRIVAQHGFTDANISADIPGLDALVQVRQAQLALTNDDKLSQRYRLSFETTLPLNSKELAENLQIWALPLTASDDAASQADWSQAPIIDKEVLKRAQLLSATPDPTARAEAPAFFLPASIQEKSHFLYLQLAHGVHAQALGQAPSKLPSLAQDWQALIKIPQLAARIEFLQPGNLLTLAGSRSLSLYSTGIERLITRVWRIRDEFLALSAQQYAPLSNEDYVQDKAMAEEKVTDLPAAASSQAQFAHIDLTGLLRAQGPGLFQIETTGWVRNKEGKYEEVTRASKRLLVTDSAVIVKEAADSSMDVFVASFASQSPIPGALAQLLAANGTIIESVRTNDQGRAHFDSVKGLQREKRPVAVIVRAPGPAGGGAISLKEDLSWLSLEDGGNRAWNNFSQGRHLGANAPSGMAFADRGVVRPGETLHFGILVKSPQAENVSEKLPLQAVITGPTGEKLLRSDLALDAMGLASLTVAIPRDQVPGPIRLDVTLAGTDDIVASSSAIVEDFVPDTLQLSAHLPESAPKGWLAADAMDMPVRLTSLFGSGTAGREVRGEISLTGITTQDLSGWQGFSFGEDNTQKNPQRRTLTSQATDETGAATVHIPALAPASLSRATLSLEGLEAGSGRATVRSLSWLVSSDPWLVGTRLVDTTLPASSLRTGIPATLELAAVNRDLSAHANAQLSARISKTRYATELVADGSGHLIYRDTPIDEELKTLPIKTDDKGLARIELPTKDQGTFSVSILSGTAVKAQFSYATTGNSLQERTGDLPTAKVRARIRQSDLEPGESTKIAVLSPFDGFGLLTVEGSQTDAAKWVPIQRGENTLDFTAPDQAFGRRYINLALIRSSEKNSEVLSGYAETSLPINIGKKEKTLAVSLTVPEQMSEATSIPVTIKTSQDARVFLWAVDEGILGLTDYKTPDPLFWLLENRALEVQTRRVLDRLMPQSPDGIATISAFGGDSEGSLHAMAKALVNPFKRSMAQNAVWWGGIVDATDEGTTVTAKLPAQFNGKVRFLAVAASSKALGSTQTDITIAQPLAVSTVLPRAVAPGDTFTLAADIAAGSDAPMASDRTGELTISAPSGMKVTPQQTSFVFPHQGSARVMLQGQAPASPMSAELLFKVRSQDLTATHSDSVSVRPASLAQTWQTGDTLEVPANGTLHFSAPVSLYNYQSQTSLAIGTRPLPWLAALAQPLSSSWGWHSIFEQIAAAWTYESLAYEPEAVSMLGDSEKVSLEARKRHDAAIQAISSNLSADGVAPVVGAPSDLFATAFSLDYLLSVKNRLAVPSELLSSVRERLLELTSTDVQNLDDFRSVSYALWVLTKEGTLTTNRIAALLQNASDRFPEWRQDTSALFLSAALRRLRLLDQANELASAANSLRSSPMDLPWNEPLARALALSAMEEDPQGAPAALRDAVLEDLREAMHAGNISGSYSAAVVRALIKNTAVPTADKTQIDLRCSKRAPGFTGGADVQFTKSGARMLDAPGCIEFTAAHAQPKQKLFWQITQTGYRSDATTQPVAHGLEINREYLDQQGRIKREFAAGDLVTVRITLRTYAALRKDAQAQARNIVVADLFPGGLEAIGAPAAQTIGADRTIRGDDRILMRFDRIGPSPVTVTYTMRAITPGRYRIPSIQAQSLSDMQLRASGSSGSLVIAASATKP